MTEECPVCNGTGWIQPWWGEYRMDGIPCSACEEMEWGEWETGDAYKMSHTSLAREWDDMPDDWGLDLVE